MNQMTPIDFLQKDVGVQVLDFVNIALGAGDKSKHAVALVRP